MDTSQHEGREPSQDPDVFVDIEKVKVDEIYLDVEHSKLISRCVRSSQTCRK